MSPFIVQNDQVLWLTEYGPATLDEHNVNGLLDTWQEISTPTARKLWLALEEAASQTSWFIGRTVIWRSAQSQPCGVGPSDLTGPHAPILLERAAS